MSRDPAGGAGARPAEWVQEYAEEIREPVEDNVTEQVRTTAIWGWLAFIGHRPAPNIG